MAEEAKGGAAPKKMMVAIDESQCSHYALEWALDNLSDYIVSSSPIIIFTAQANITVNYVYASSIGASCMVSSQQISSLAATTPELVRTLQEQQHKIALALLQKAKEICALRGVSVETVTQVGDPKEVICEAVEKFKVNLIVLGSHGKGAIKRTFLGSVSNYCVHNAKCPVLVVKKPA